TITTNAIMLNVLGDKHTKDKELETCERAKA
ncbi:phosphoribosylaminoimidazole carboxylase, partial [Cronobacter sakazakii]